MICELLPTSYARHLSLPLLGSVLDDFDDWLVAQGYQFGTRQCYVLRCTAIEAYFHKRRQHSLATLTRESLRKCWAAFSSASRRSIRHCRMLAALSPKSADAGAQSTRGYAVRCERRRLPSVPDRSQGTVSDHY